MCVCVCVCVCARGCASDQGAACAQKLLDTGSIELVPCELLALRPAACRGLTPSFLGREARLLHSCAQPARYDIILASSSACVSLCSNRASCPPPCQTKPRLCLVFRPERFDNAIRTPHRMTKARRLQPLWTTSGWCRARSATCTMHSKVRVLPWRFATDFWANIIVRPQNRASTWPLSCCDSGRCCPSQSLPSLDVPSLDANDPTLPIQPVLPGAGIPRLRPCPPPLHLARRFCISAPVRLHAVVARESWACR